MKPSNRQPFNREYILVHNGEIIDELVLPPDDVSNPRGGADLAVEYFAGKPGIIYFGLGKQDERYAEWRKG